MSGKHAWLHNAGSVFAWSLCAMGLFVFMAGCPGVQPPAGNENMNAGGNENENENENENDNGAGEPRAFAGATTCMPCHQDAHANWTATNHAGALETLEAIGQDQNAVCLPCHTVGFGEGGFVSRAETPDLAGVQCENCHGAAAAHTANPGDPALRPTVNMAATLCGGCHTDPHHPTFDEWQLSKHAMALEGLKASGFAQDSCLQCHSQDYRHAIEEGEEPPTIATAQLSIECATCHNPHGGVAQEHLLRQPIANLCGECHTQGEEALPGNTPHHPQLEMLTGTGAVDADANPLAVPFSPHASLFTGDGQACAQCHVVRHEVEEPNEGNPNVTGHTFNPFDEDITAVSPEHQPAMFDGCLMCHSAEGAEERFTRVQEEIETRVDALEPFFNTESDQYIDSAALSEADQARLATARFNFQFVEADDSDGVHNSFYARAALDVAEAIVNDLTQSP